MYENKNLQKTFSFENKENEGGKIREYKIQNGKGQCCVHRLECECGD